MNHSRITSNSNIKNILVVGAGIAGPIVCYWLKKSGFTPSLIEKSDALRKGGHAVDIRGIAIDIVKKMGIYDEIAQHRTQLQVCRYVDSEGKTFFEEQGEAAGFREGDELEIVRGDLIHILMKTIEDVPVHFQESIAAINQDEQGVEVVFKTGQTKTFDLVIGCDGLHSSTRSMIFSEDEYQLKHLECYISVFSLPNYLQLHHSEILYENEKQLVHVSSDKDAQTAHAGFMFRSSRLLEDERNIKAQKQFLKEHFSHSGWETDRLLEFMDNADDLYFDSISQIKMPLWSKGRVVLVGDAGYCASPLSGQGTSLALVGAYLLAGELKAARGNYHLAFQRYNSLMRPYVEANQSFGEWVSQNVFKVDRSDNEEQRNQVIMEKMKQASNAMSLPEY